MRKLLHCLSWSAVFMMAFCFWAPVVSAHPLGNFTINHYAGLQVAREGIGIDYVLDMAEIPAFQEINHLDLDDNYKTDPRETVNYPVKKCNAVNSQLELWIDRQPLTLSLGKSTVEFPPGVGGLSTLRLTCDFQGSKALSGANQLVEFEDKSYSRRLGWREITVVADIPIQGNLTSSSISNRLIDYPNDLLSSPLNQRQISFEINPLPEASQQAAQPSAPSSIRLDNALTGRSNDIFTSLITQKEYNLLTIPIALAIAFVWGGLHALSPGHGKTIAGAYLIGSRSSAQHALFLGLTVTITHTAGIFALGLLALGTSQFTLTEDLYPWLSVFSGVLVTGIGLHLFVSRLRGTQHRHTHEHEHHSHTHTHTSEIHAHHDHEHEHDHSHLPLDANGSMTWSSLLALGISGGLLPCPSALVVLLGAIALGRIGLGLALVSAFSLGLAAVLTGIGLLLVYAKKLFERLSIHPPRLRMLPAVSALFITLMGLGITTQTLFMYAGK
ncbi:MAG: sulfite exporter TauE/SafE family protein [Chroococcidiopsidaceae cyanobacterium CP_BM_ER_R8_30]|nr:sulfite exporter TauE/SafE family protein [Chroococcidiopsidaceae cyanobacterium CP_BM_ER_R8_30]